MKPKVKGSNAERELVHKFWDAGWAIARVAGSGSTSLPAPDLIAGFAGKTLAIECKVTSSNIQYFTKDEIESLQEFAARFEAEPWVAVKFNRDAWYFTPAQDLEPTDSALKLSQERAKMTGFSFDDMTKRQPL